MSIEIVNLTPHNVTIIRPDGCRVDFPACEPSKLPRATEAPHAAPYGWLTVLPGDDTQVACETAVALEQTGIVASTGYTGIENLPQLEMEPWPGPPARCYIVSIVTAIGAIAAGRLIVDLLVPMGRVRDPQGRVIGATGLAPAADLLGPMVLEIKRRATAPLDQRMDELRAVAKRAGEALAKIKRDGERGLIEPVMESEYLHTLVELRRMHLVPSEPGVRRGVA